MPRRAQNRVLRVRLIEQSPLGLQFLLSFLRKDSSIRIVGIQDLKGQDEKRNTVGAGYNRGQLRLAVAAQRVLTRTASDSRGGQIPYPRP